MSVPCLTFGLAARRPLGGLALSAWLLALAAFALASCPGLRTTAVEGFTGQPSSDEGDDGGKDEATGPLVAEAEPDEAPPSDDPGAPEGFDAPLAGGRVVPLDPEPLTGFFEALAELEQSGAGTVRVLQYGDSHTAGDHLTSAIASRLKQRFGDGGRGFVLAGKPWRTFRLRDTEIVVRGRWQAERITVAGDPTRQDGRYGLGGIMFETGERDAAVEIAPTDGLPVGSFELFYLRQPGGGSFAVHVDGVRRATVATSSGRLESGFLKIDVPPGGHALEVRVRGDGPVRLFGVVLESGAPGVVYDMLGINGAFLYTQLRWDATLQAEQIARRAPELVVTMYGTNESSSRSLTPEGYEHAIRQVVGRLRDAAPGASCLLLGPPDRVNVILPRQTVDTTSRLDWIIARQRAVAEEQGCAFIDVRELMGGPGSFARLRGVVPPLASGDGLHLMARGYVALGAAIGDQLLAAYDAWRGNPDARLALRQVAPLTPPGPLPTARKVPIAQHWRSR